MEQYKQSQTAEPQEIIDAPSTAVEYAPVESTTQEDIIEDMVQDTEQSADMQQETKETGRKSKEWKSRMTRFGAYAVASFAVYEAVKGGYLDQITSHLAISKASSLEQGIQSFAIGSALVQGGYMAHGWFKKD